MTQPDPRGDLLPYHRRLGRALRDVLLARGVFTDDELRREIEQIDSPNPGNGARLVASAWVDPAFKRRLLENPRAAAAELGIDTGPRPIRVVESTQAIHNVIVCTLCSCYPWAVLGLPPVWYKSAPYRSRAVADPRGVLKEFGVDLADEVELKVWDSTAELRYLVIPLRPAGTEGWSEERLANIVTRDAMIGVAQLRLGQAK